MIMDHFRPLGPFSTPTTLDTMHIKTRKTFHPLGLRCRSQNSNTRYVDNQEPLPYLVEPVENVTEGQTSDIPPESDHGSFINPSLVSQCGDDYCGSDSWSQYPLTECSQSLVGVVKLLLTLHWILKAQEKRVFLQVPESFVFLVTWD